MQRRRFMAMRAAGLLCLLTMGMLSVSAPSFAGPHRGELRISRPFHGVKANTGTVSYTREGDRNVLTLSDDFQIPDAPAPHWQIVDSLGNTYLLERLKIKGDKVNLQITLPPYIHDIAKVQIWCAWAETLLGEASFRKALK